MAYNYLTVVKLGTTNTGLTLTAKLYDTGNSLIATVTSGFTELGDGEYTWYYTSMPDNFVGTIRFYNGATYLTSGVVAEAKLQDVLSVVQANGCDD
jgi:hypothetical protein